MSASYIVSASESLGQSIKSQLPKRKVNVIPNGIYPKKVISKKEKRILVVARLFINKGVQDILEALKEVNLNDWRVDIVGDGPCREELEVTAAGSSFARKIKFHGWLANGSKELDSLYSKSAIFISASYFESFSTVLLEALSYSCDVLATKVGGNPEIVEKENLFLPRDPSSLANRLKKAMSEYNGKPRKCLYLNRFDWTKIYEKYLDLLERAK